jgi:hypothetical protein
MHGAVNMHVAWLLQIVVRFRSGVYEKIIRGGFPSRYHVTSIANSTEVISHVAVCTAIHEHMMNALNVDAWIDDSTPSLGF